MTSRPLARYLAARTALLARVDGSRAAQTLSDLTDEALVELADQASARSGARFALFAVGGYGAGRMLPHSDVDLLIIVDGKRSEVERTLQALLYPLWDGGLRVGHQVRSVKEQVRMLGEDLDTTTAFLSARMLAGDERLASQAISAGFRRVRAQARTLLDRIASRDRPGSPFLLEPDLKEGAGGQRDCDELAWRAAIVCGGPSPDARPLVPAGFLTPTEGRALAGAQEVVTEARWHVQSRSRRPTDVLTLEAAEDMALDAEAVQRALATISDTLTSVRARMSGTEERPQGPLDLAWLRARAGGGDAGLAELERAAHGGLFDAWCPGFSDLMTLRRPGLSHRYTVGAHSLRTAAIVASSDRATARPAPGALDAALLVAALTHDAGKRDGVAGHALRGAEIAREAARRLGLDAEAANAAAVLVREHLLLGDVATRADLDDEDVVLSTAARIGDRRLCGPLFELCAADMQATGPGVWTPWRASLVAELARKLEVALAPESDGAGIVAAARETRAVALRDAASVGAPRTVIEFISDAPLRYLATRAPSEVIRDARLVQQLSGPGSGHEVAVAVEPGPTERTWLVRVATRDRPGLFATLAGAFELAGFALLSAEAHTTLRGVALDSFTVTPATLAEPDEATWASVRRTLVEAVRASLDLEAALAERRSHYARVAQPSRPRVRVTVDEGAGTALRVHVRAPDRVGLLHDLARVLAEQGLDIRRATVTTVSGVADDVFHVADATGQPLTADALLARLHGPLASAASPGHK